LGVVRGHAQLGSPVADGHLGDMFQQDRVISLHLDDRLAQLLGAVGGEDAPHDVLVPVLVQHAPRDVLVHPLGRLDHLVQPHAVMHHLARVEQYLVLLDLTAQHGHLRHTLDRQ
jgi:hypothetical protein